MAEMTCGEGVCLLDEDYEGSFAFRAALVTGAQGFHVCHLPGSRADFVQALQLLGAEPKVGRLQNHLNTRRMMRVHRKLFPRQLGTGFWRTGVCRGNRRPFACFPRERQNNELGYCSRRLSGQ